MDSPQRKLQSRQLTHLLHEYMGRYGYEVIELPIIEAADLFLIKAGDQIINRLFTFERHGRQFALRPEFTAAAAFRYIQDRPQSVVRWQFSGAVFEDDPNDTERSYQRLSLGAELIGMAGTNAEAEIIGMAALGLSETGIDRWYIHMGHMRLLRQIIARFGLDSRTERFILHRISALCDPQQGKAAILEQLDRLTGRTSDVRTESDPEADSQHLFEAFLDATAGDETLGGRTRQDIARRLLQKRQRAADRGQIIKALDTLLNWCAIDLPPDPAFQIMNELAGAPEIQQTLAEWKAVVDLLEAYEIGGERITIRPGLARSWEYYTGIVFDLTTVDGRPLGGGGRYDELARLIGGEYDIPAVGFAYYLDQLFTAGSGAGELPSALTLAVIPENAVNAARWAHRLRQKGFTVRLLPPEQVNNPFASLVIGDSGCAVWNNKTYALSEIDSLIDELERVSL